MENDIVVFAPHPDDETLGCGGTIAKKLSEGRNVYVVFVTDGRYALSELGIYSNPTPLEMKEIRREEALRAAEMLGLQERNLVFLDFEDKTLAKHEAIAQERILKILRDFSPAEVFFPQGREYNVDHRATNKIVKNALESSNLYPIEYEYIIAWRFPFYLLLHVFDESTFDRFTAKFQSAKLIYLDISRFLSAKKAAINEYKSQVTALCAQQKRPALKSSFLKRFLKSEEKFLFTNRHSVCNLSSTII